MANARVTNNLDVPIDITAYVNHFDGSEPRFTPPLHVLNSFELFTPPDGWRPGGIGWCGTGTGGYTLAPGKSIDVHLAAPTIAGAFVRYTVHYRRGDGARASAISPAVQLSSQ